MLNNLAEKLKIPIFARPNRTETFGRAARKSCGKVFLLSSVG
jgi:hypothetical protein